MSESIRQNNLFSGEDYRKIFKAYQFIDYTAYDFDTLKQALINYIQTYYPEDFNDYIESSEFIAIIELIAYLGTSLAFRTDLNSRENFIDTAERRESVIRLAQMVNYTPKRNIAASGLFKIDALETNQPLTDSNGIPINDVAIFWNDPNNPDWFDQFVQICNATFSPLNPFGRPTKSGAIGSIPTDLYQLNNITRLSVTYPITISVNGQQYPVDVCNPDLINNERIFERDPNPSNPFNFIYRNDSLGVGSANTGFFLYFRQGTLQNVDVNFEFPVPNRLFPIDLTNINQDDVYIQETDQTGSVISQWARVPALAGENVIYNSIQFAQRNIFDVISGAGDTVTVRFADGNFGNVPTGLFRAWVRPSANEALVIRPEAAQGLQISIPYIGANQQQYNLRVTFSLEQTISNAAPAETDEQIRLRAPEVFSTQSRMVNGSDYNVLPLVYGNQIAKLQAINRTYSGQSRYIDLNDPTGFHRDLIIFGEDGALFRDNQNVLRQVISDSSNSGSIESILVNTVQEMLRDPKVINFYYDEYLPQFESTVRVNRNEPTDPDGPQPEGYSLLELANPNQLQLYWKTSPEKFKNDTGFFANDTIPGSSAVTLVNTLDSSNPNPGQDETYQPWGFIKAGAILSLGIPGNDSSVQSATVNNVVQSGLPLTVSSSNPYASIGPVELGREIQRNYRALKVTPPFRNDLNSTEIDLIVQAVDAGISFWLYYDLLTDSWGTSVAATPGLSDQSEQPWKYAPVDVIGLNQQIYSTWAPYPASGLIYISIASDNQVGTTTYDLTARGRVYVFESYRDVRFFWEPGQVVIDNASGLALQDTIEVMPMVNTNSTVDNNQPIIDPVNSYLKKEVLFNLSGVYIQNDGYQDTSKIEVSLSDANNDGIPDDPQAFNRLVSPEERVVFEYFADEVTGYQTTRPWVCRWNTTFKGYTGNLYVYFPVLNSGDTTLFSSPFISNINPASALPGFALDPESVDPAALVAYMSDLDLMFVNNLLQIESISAQVTAFFNNDAIAYPDSTAVTDKIDIVTEFFINKSYLDFSVSPPGYGKYYTLAFEDTDNLPTYPTGKVISVIDDRYHYDRNGKSFTQNTSVEEIERIPLYFKWSHYSPIDQRVDPAPSNIIDMIAITDSYYRDVLIWKNSNGSIQNLPAPPTTEELRVQFQDLNQYKMVSDSIVWNSGKFKVLFGTQAEPELQATFKVVKAPSSSVSDNEVKTKVIEAIDAYFDIRNWDFGEKFFYTELAAFIHQQLSRIISSVVIVPNNASSQFGNLFEIAASPDELFISTATVNNVQIVVSLTDQNLRV